MIKSMGLTNIKLHDRDLPIGNKTYIVGVLNITPDSLGGGFYNDLNGALDHTYRLVEEGADILEIGGESTRPGARTLSSEEVIERIGSVLKYLIKNIDIPITIDTYSSEVARFALDVGVHIINDVSGLRADSKMVEVINEYKSCVVICRERETGDRFSKEYRLLDSYIFAIELILKENLIFALENGIPRERIILDPRIGSGITSSQPLLHKKDCLDILKNQKQLLRLGQPLMTAHSLKTFIGEILGELPVEERIVGTDAVTAYCIMNGVDFVRVHNVKRTYRIAKVIDEIVRNKE